MHLPACVRKGDCGIRWYQLETFSVVCGAYSVKANAEGVKQTLVNEGYTAMVVYNAERNLYRVVIGTFDDRASAENLRDSFKAKTSFE